MTIDWIGTIDEINEEETRQNAAFRQWIKRAHPTMSFKDQQALFDYVEALNKEIAELKRERLTQNEYIDRGIEYQRMLNASYNMMVKELAG